MPPDLPPAAVQAAANQLELVTKMTTTGAVSWEQLAEVALETAAPLIRADERQRWTRIEPDPEQPGYSQGVWDISAMVAEEVAAERERIAKLAEQHDACYLKQVRTPVNTVPPTVDLKDAQMPFADLIREEAGPG